MTYRLADSAPLWFVNLGAFARSQLQCLLPPVGRNQATLVDALRWSRIIRAVFHERIAAPHLSRMKPVVAHWASLHAQWNCQIRGSGMSLERLFEEARNRMGPSREERLKDARARSEEFNRRAAKDFAAQQVTRELLAKTCSL